MAKASPKVILNVRVDPSYVERLDVLADKMGLDRPELLRRVLRNGIEGMEELVMIAGNPVGLAMFELVKFLESDPKDREEMARVIRNVARQKYLGQKPLLGKTAPA